MLRLFASLIFALLFSVTTYAEESGTVVYIDDKIIKLGTGKRLGFYQPVGDSICRVINKQMKSNILRCYPIKSTGSLENIENLRLAKIDFALVQSDLQDYAFYGTNIFQNKGEFKNLRFVFSLYIETLVMLVNHDSSIRILDDVLEKNINIGTYGSETREIMDDLFAHKGWNDSNFRNIYKMRLEEEPEALCNRMINVMTLTTGHPSPLIKQTTERCEVRLININDSIINKMVEDNKVYIATTIPGGTYIGNPNDIATFGVKVALLTTSDMSDEIVYKVTKSIFSNLEKFKNLHPVLNNLDVKKMITEGQIAPIHPGAERYYREQGYLNNAPTSETVTQE